MARRRMEGNPTHREQRAPEEEQWLVERAKRDPEAFGELYDMHFDRIYAYIYRKTGDRQVAEDLTSETFMKALANLKGYRYTGQPFIAWLYRIAANIVTDHYRSRRVTTSLDEGLQLPDRGTSPEEAALRLDDQQAVARAIQSLSPDQQDVILLRFSGDMKLRDIGQVIGKTEGAVKALMFRALNSLKGKLTESGVRP
ncbi:MAG TPA: sigma-70 family RNA polymerase sigma factor [Symbiobacteriaceae bacterium]|nr:sigma-70 family RNA polymerase sigma factor [Symbiobacteriaceae bacterium]